MAEKKKHPGGRPTNYRDRYCDTSQYLKQCDANDELPTICGYAVYLKTNHKILCDWANRHPEFRKALDDLLDLQQRQLLDRGLKGTYNSTIAKLVLASNHGMTDRQDVTSGGEPLSAPVIRGPASKDTE